MSNLFAFISHGSASLVGTGTEIEARALAAIMNYGRALNVVTVQKITAAEAGVEPVFKISDELKRSAKAAQAKGTLDNPDHPAFARPVPADKDRIRRYDSK